MGTSWISRKGVILENGEGGVDLEKGGMTLLTNYASGNDENVDEVSR